MDFTTKPYFSFFGVEIWQIFKVDSHKKKQSCKIVLLKKDSLICKIAETLFSFIISKVEKIQLPNSSTVFFVRKIQLHNVISNLDQARAKKSENKTNELVEKIFHEWKENSHDNPLQLKDLFSILDPQVDSDNNSLKVDPPVIPGKEISKILKSNNEGDLSLQNQFPEHTDTEEVVSPAESPLDPQVDSDNNSLKVDPQVHVNYDSLKVDPQVDSDNNSLKVDPQVHVNYDSLKVDSRLLNLDFNLKTSRVSQELFQNYQSQVFDKFSQQINLMKRMGVSDEIISKAVESGHFSVLLWFCIRSVDMRNSPHNLQKNIDFISFDKFNSICKLFDCLKEDKGNKPLKYSDRKQRKTEWTVTERRDSAENLAEIEYMTDFFDKNRDIHKCFKSGLTYNLAGTTEVVRIWAFNHEYTPTSDLCIDDIQKIYLNSRSEIAIALKDGRVSVIASEAKDFLYWKNEIPELKEKFVTNKFSQNLQRSHHIGRNQTNEPWTVGHIERILRTSIYQYPFGFQNIIGDEIDKFREDIHMSQSPNYGWQGGNWQQSKYKYRSYGLEDYVNQLLCFHKHLLFEFTKSGFSMEKIKEVAKKGHFFLVLRICRDKSPAEAIAFYDQISRDPLDIDKYNEDYSKRQRARYHEDILFFEKWKESDIHNRNRIIEPDDYLNFITTLCSSDYDNPIRYSALRINGHRIPGLRRNHSNMWIPTNLALFLAKKGELRNWLNQELVEPDRLKDLDTLEMLANLYATDRLTEEDLNQVVDNPNSESAQHVIEKAKRLIDGDISEWQNIQEKRGKRLEWDEYTEISIVRNGLWSVERLSYITKTTNIKRANYT